MAVYSEFSEKQISDLSSAIDGMVSNLKGIEAGISNTIYEATVERKSEKEKIILMVHETPDRIAHGTSAEQSRNIPELMFYAAGNIGTKGIEDYDGIPVQTAIPLPYLWDYQDTSRTMQFKHATEDRMVDKTVSIFPFMEGRELDWKISKCQNVNDIRQAGRGLAVLHKAVEGFPNAVNMSNSYGFHKWMNSVESLLNNSNAEMELNNFLYKKNSAFKASDILMRLDDEANFIENNWYSNTQDLPKNIIHGDYFPDNTMITPTGKQIIFDFGNSALEVEAYDIALSINAWTSENGIFIPENVDAFLDGYNSVKTLSSGVMQQLPFLGRAAAFSRALLRIDIALNTTTPSHANSPEDCMVQLEHWKNEDNKVKNATYYSPHTSYDP